MRCTEGRESGTCSAFWEILWGVVVSADAVRGSRAEAERSLALVGSAWAGSKSEFPDFSGRPGK